MSGFVYILFSNSSKWLYKIITLESYYIGAEGENRKI